VQTEGCLDGSLVDLPLLVIGLEPKVVDVGRVSPADKALEVYLLVFHRGNGVGLSRSFCGPASLSKPDWLSLCDGLHVGKVVLHGGETVLGLRTLPESESVKHDNVHLSNEIGGLLKVDICVGDWHVGNAQAL